MQKTRFTKSLSFILCILLIAAIAVFTTGCNDNSKTTEPSTTQATTAASTSESNVLGEGKTEFKFTVTDTDGKETEYEIHTDKATVGEALLELDLIAGDESDYGLYVKTVTGTTLDYDTDGKYWAFYINGEYASTGVDSTQIEAGATYAFKAE